MQRIDSIGAVAELPAPAALGSPGYFNQVPPGSDAPPTRISADWLNMIQEEVVAPIAYAGIPLDKTNHGQLLTAILTIVGGAGVVGAGAIFGLELSNTPANPNTQITISLGVTRDSTNTAGLSLAGPLTKDLTAAWAQGNALGGRDQAGVAVAAGQTWHVHLILNPASGVVDALFSQSATAPNLPTGFTKFRRLGAILTDAGDTNIRQFIQTGDWFKYKTRSTDFANTANGSGTAYYRQISVPVGVKVEAELYFQSFGTADTNSYHSGVYDPDFGTPTAFGGATQWSQAYRRSVQTNLPGGAAYNSYATGIVRQFTNASGYVYTYSDDPADVIALGVLGWRDERGKFY